MREKPAKGTATTKTLNFLFALKGLAGKNNENTTLTDLQQLHQINRSTARACQVMNLIKRESKYIWQWIGNEPNKTMALEVLDLLLHKNKKVVPSPIIPEFATLVKQISDLTERMGVYMVQNERVLKTAKNGQITEGYDLFRIDDKKLYIVGQIVSKVYVDYLPSSPESHQYVKELNSRIIDAADDLINQMRGSNQDRLSKISFGNENGHVMVDHNTHYFLGKCMVCGTSIFSDEPHAQKIGGSVGEYLCQSHLSNPL